MVLSPLKNSDLKPQKKHPIQSPIKITKNLKECPSLLLRGRADLMKIWNHSILVSQVVKSVPQIHL